MNRVYFYPPRGGWPTNVIVPSEQVQLVADRLLNRSREPDLGLDWRRVKALEFVNPLPRRFPVEKETRVPFQYGSPGIKLQVGGARDRAVKALLSIRGE